MVKFSGIMRKAVFAGLFYEKNPTRLLSQLRGCFGDWNGTKKAGRAIKGCIVPHAGYAFSGACAASAYKELAESAIPDAYIIIGLSHQGYETCISKEDWETPLGIVKTDSELVDEIGRQGIKIDDGAHLREHSIEVQLPFLQYIHQGEDIQIAALIASQDIEFRKIAGCIKNAVNKLKRKIVVIASSDFTHYGKEYGYCPFATNIKENMYKLDKGAIDRILRLDLDGFVDYCERTEATICGRWPIAAAIELCKNTKGRLVKYCTSADITKDYSSAVGYASIVFE